MVTLSEIFTKGGPWGGIIVLHRRSVELSTPSLPANSSVVSHRACSRSIVIAHFHTDALLQAENVALLD